MCVHVCDFANTTWFFQNKRLWDPYSVPGGIRFLRGAQRDDEKQQLGHDSKHGLPHVTATCTKPPPELGVDGAWLPVTSVWTQRKPIGSGVWLYYARGCSDFAWSAGRTMLAKNRCDAALQLQRRVMLRENGSAREDSSSGARPTAERGPGIRRLAAARRVAEWLLTPGHLPYHSHHAQIQKALALAGSAFGHNLSLSELLVVCAAGLYENTPGDCREALAQEEDPRSPTAHRRLPRAYALTTLAGHDLLDLHNVAALRNLSHHYRLNSSTATAATAATASTASSAAAAKDGTRAASSPLPAGATASAESEDERPFDTIQLWQQPQGGGQVLWTSEIWDVRHLDVPVGLQSRTAAAHSRGTIGFLNGSECATNREFAQCKACKASRLEHNCQSYSIVMKGHSLHVGHGVVADGCAAAPRPVG